MDCFFHTNVPSVARCTDCTRTICATCRDDAGTCPSCRLAARVAAAAAARGELRGSVSRTGGRAATVATLDEPVESRALVALGYPFWPLALLSLLDSTQSRYLRRQAYQSLLFNFGMYGFLYALMMIGVLPLIGWSADVLLPFIIPITVVADVVYGLKAWHRKDVRIPFVSDWLDQRLPA
ncbi:MAG: hypothetical protein M3Z14_02040 [Candidatus Eremiobacteraeota bacterium]|nr:hypothetical protein [Candidatus Eremiobacteraeota bacterium]